MKTRSLFYRMALISTALTPAILNAAPFSDSMAECAAQYQNAAQWVETDAATDKLMYAARAWADAAIAQATAEGIADAQDTMWAAIDAKTAVWEAKGPLLFGTEEFRDWMNYCRSFAADRGIAFEE